MRTTIDIDDDVLAAAKELARAEGKTAGQMLSELARRGLVAARSVASGFAEAQAPLQPDADDWPTFPDRTGPPVTNDLVRRIQDELDREDATPFDFGGNASRSFRAT